jgi:hypothetical protein
MTSFNSSFPIYNREALLSRPGEVAHSLLRRGVCYVTGYEGLLNVITSEFDSLNLLPDGKVASYNPARVRQRLPSITSALFAKEFRSVKQKIFGIIYRDEIEIMCQRTAENKAPDSGDLHFDKRYTFKSWYYVNDIGLNEGPMRVVPPDYCPDLNPSTLRKKFGTRSLFKGSRTKHHATGDDLELLEAGAEFVTGPAGTLFLHITEAWHGASPVLAGSERQIIRGHTRSVFDRFVK